MIMFFQSHFNDTSYIDVSPIHDVGVSASLSHWDWYQLIRRLKFVINAVKLRVVIGKNNFHLLTRWLPVLNHSSVKKINHHDGSKETQGQ